MTFDRTPACGCERTDAAEQVEELLGIAEAPHPPQHRRARVLERQVEVRDDAGRGRQRLDQRRPHLGRLEVGQPHACDAVDRGHLRQQLFEQPDVAEILSVRRRVLTDKNDFADAVGSQPSRLAENLRRRARHERAAKRRDRAERTSPVTAGRELQRRGRAVIKPLPQHPGATRVTGNPDIGDHRGPTDGADRQQCSAVARQVRHERPTGQHVIEPVTDRGVVVERQDDGFWKRLGKFTAVALRQASDGDHLAAGRRVGGREQRVDRVLLRRFDEAAGVDDGDVSARRVGELPARFGHAGRELFGVDVVARAAQGDQMD